jgi:hypothetical protein
VSSDCSIICGLPDPPWEAAGRDLPPAPQSGAIGRIASAVNSARAQRRAFYPARSSQRVSPGGPRKNERPRRKVVRAGASLPEITLGGSNRAAAIILLA